MLRTTMIGFDIHSFRRDFCFTSAGGIRCSVSAMIGQCEASNELLMADSAKNLAETCPTPSVPATSLEVKVHHHRKHGQRQSFGTKNILKNAATALAANDILYGRIAEVTYDGTPFRMQGESGSAVSGLSTSLTNSHFYVGNGSAVAADLAVSGDLSLC